MEARNIKLTLEKVKEWFKSDGDLREVALQAFKSEELSDINISLLKDSFIIEAEGKKLRVSYEEYFGNHEDAMVFCKEHGGGDETIENIHLISEYKNEINKELKAHGKEPIDNWYWTNKISRRRINCAFVVSTRYSSVYDVTRTRYTFARAVSAL